MTAFLHRLGRYSVRRRWLVLVVWLVVFAAIAVGGFVFGGKLGESFTIPGTQSQNALDRLNAVFPKAAGGSAQAVVLTESGRIDEGPARFTVEDLVTRIEAVDGVASVTSPFSEYATRAISDDGVAAIVSFQFTTPSAEVPDATVEELERIAETGRDSGLTVALSGGAFGSGGGVPVNPYEFLGVAFAGLVLVLTFGSLLAAGMPLVAAILGVVLSLAALQIAALAMTVSEAAPTLALMLGLAVGIDYGLFVISRHREQLATGMDVEESIAASIATAGTAVVFAGATVVIALLGLLVVGIPFLSVMGAGAAFAVTVEVLATVTLLPALLAFCGRRLVPKAGSRTERRILEADRGEARTFGARWVALVMKVPVLALIGVVALLGVLSIPVASMQVALPTNGQEPQGTGPRIAYDAIAEHFGPGRNGPLTLLVDVTQNNDFVDALDGLRTRIEALPDVEAVGPGTPNESLDTAVMTVVPESGPTDARTVALVQRIRDLAPQLERTFDLEIAVTGSTAVQIDISTRLGQSFVPFVLVVVGLSVVLLMAVFRSVLVPLKAAFGFLLSIAASLGITVAVFQWGWGAELLGTEPAPLLSFLPILVIAILFGLSMDYEVFIVSGIRETWVHTGDPRYAVRRGLVRSSRVVLAAALIMIFVFASFVPEGDGTIKPIALALALGVFFDAFLVRTTLVPAVMTLAGRAGWWLPRWLGRALPAVDIEGEGLVRQQAEQAWAAGEGEWALSAAGLVPAVGGLDPLDLAVRPGTVATLAVPADARRAVVATLTGHLAPASGRLQVEGVPAPSGAPEVRRIAAPVLDDGTAVRLPIGELLQERLRLAPRALRRGSVAYWLERMRSAAQQGQMAGAEAGRTGFDRRLPLGALVAEQRLLVLAVAALAGGATVLVVDAGDIGRDAERRLAAALRALTGEPALEAADAAQPRTGATAVLVDRRGRPVEPHPITAVLVTASRDAFAPARLRPVRKVASA